ncbi:aminotransferase class IV [Saprospira grandis]|uniref:Aminotransferase class IV n=1 Tax=Saprospira grandis (strain Lewin) TaxID=984262 RepID=H6KZW1_SAPGL|nr:aminotransferase class IV [Saprospira grandis]AFC25968.1 aminotransferase class IV [Saprospira grandis str. Lewin]
MNNRGFKYGDGVFESIRVGPKGAPLLPWHERRLRRSLDQLGILAPEDFQLASFIRLGETYRLRLSCWRAGGGLYTPEENGLAYALEEQPLQAAAFPWPKKGLHLGVYKGQSIAAGGLSFLKSLSAQTYVMAAKYRQEAGFDDCILLNAWGRVVESVAANIWIRKGEQWATPALSEGPVAGVFRAYLLDVFRQQGVVVEEKALSIADCLAADEIWLTNAVQGISWVREFLGQRYTCSWAELWQPRLNARLWGK